MLNSKQVTNTDVESAINALVQTGHFSAGSLRTFRQVFIAFQKFLCGREFEGLDQASSENCHLYLLSRRSDLSQKSLAVHRQALQALLAVQGKMSFDERLESVVSQKKKKKTKGGLDYRPIQIQAILEQQYEANALATKLAFACGLRASEILTIATPGDRPADQNTDTSPCLWQGLPDSATYSVIGPKGKIREIRVPIELARELEKRRRSSPKTVFDRKIPIDTYYDIAGGSAWSASFSRMSQRLFGWSLGTKGIRQTYAIQRVETLRNFGFHELAIFQAVWLEMGEFDLSYIFPNCRRMRKEV